MSLHTLGNTRPTEIQSNNTPVTVPVISRRDFITMFGRDYQQQHVTLLGPTQRGKTTLALQLLDRCISPGNKCIILAGKPLGRDIRMEKASEELNLRRISEWPPDPNFRDRNRNGYVLAPLGKPNPDSNAEERKLTDEFRRALKQTYASRKKRIIVVDETSLVYEDLKLKKEYEAPLKRGAPIVAMWSLIQRGRFITYHAYNAPEHIFIFYDPDVTNRQRYSEIGGADPRWLQEVTSRLKTKTIPTGQTISQALYIRRSGPQFYIVDTD